MRKKNTYLISTAISSSATCSPQTRSPQPTPPLITMLIAYKSASASFRSQADHPRCAARLDAAICGALSWEKPHSEPFRAMLAHPRLTPYMHEILGQGFRLDHNLGIITMRKGAEGHVLHGSSGPGFDPHQYYIFQNGRMHNGLTVVAWQLADINPGDGGLCVIPGSHKGNYPCPPALRRGETNSDFIKQITCKAGDVIIFTEAVTHGALPWTADHDRRTALFRFSPGNMAHANNYDWPSSMLDGLTPEQRARPRTAVSPAPGDRPVLD